MADEMTQSERDAIAQFPVVAEEFCRFIDNCSGFDRKRLIQDVGVLLAKLSQAATRLPLVTPSSGGADSRDESVAARANEEYQISKRLREQLGDLDEFWDVFDPTQKEEVVLCSLSRHIAEIYMDLKDALKLQGSGACLDDIYFDWCFAFRSHWAWHAASAAKAVILISHRA